MSEDNKPNGGTVNIDALIFVLMCNDEVIGVYDSEEKVEEASNWFRKKRYEETWRCPSYINRQTREGEEEFKRFIRKTLYLHTRSHTLNGTPTF